MMYGLEMVAPRKRQESGLELVMELKMLTMLRGVWACPEEGIAD